MPTYVVVDSGTSNTRVRLWKDGQIAGVASRPVGARDSAAGGHHRALSAGLQELIAEVRCGAAVDAVICSGMISSGLGLLEVPHLAAPVSLDDLARGMVHACFPDICEAPFYFVPGIKTPPGEGTEVERLSTMDMMRGEETEVAGLLLDAPLGRSSLYVHLGSHHKAILVGTDETIRSSSTALTGELLDAVRHHSLLAGTLPDRFEFEPDPVMWRLGLELLRGKGLGRALFLVRAAEQLGRRSPEEVGAMLIGMLVGLDLQMIEDYRDRVETTIIYGSGAFGPVLRDCLRRDGYGDVKLLDARRSEVAAVLGAVRLFERARALGGIVDAVATTLALESPERR